MNTITTFKNWLIAQNLDGTLDKEKRKEAHKYYRKHIYYKAYSKQNNNKRNRSNVSFSSGDFLQVKAQAARLEMPISKFINKATMQAVSRKTISASNHLTAMIQLLGLCKSDLNYLIESGDTIDKTMFTSIKERLDEIEYGLNENSTEGNTRKNSLHPNTLSPVYAY